MEERFRYMTVTSSFDPLTILTPTLRNPENRIQLKNSYTKRMPILPQNTDYSTSFRAGSSHDKFLRQSMK